MTGLWSTLRNALLATFIMVFVFALGSYLLPQLLGRPQHWTLSVLITDQAIYQSNMPFAAAMAVFLVLVTLSLVVLAKFRGATDGFQLVEEVSGAQAVQRALEAAAPGFDRFIIAAADTVMSRPNDELIAELDDILIETNEP
mgnify:CR=1 FL=1